MNYSSTFLFTVYFLSLMLLHRSLQTYFPIIQSQNLKNWNVQELIWGMFQPQNEAANEYIFICCFSFLKRSYEWQLPWQQGTNTQHHWFKQLIKDRCLKRASKQPSAFPSMSYFSTNKNIPIARKSSWILKVKTWCFSSPSFYTLITGSLPV